MSLREMNQTAWTRLVARYGHPVCPICKGQEWRVDEPLMARIMKDEQHRYGIWPFRRTEEVGRLFVPVICLECGYTLTFDHTTMVVVKG